MVDSPIRVQKLNRRKEFFAAQIQEERDRRNKFASSSSSGVGHFPFQPSSVIPQLASVDETSLHISEIVVSDILNCFQEYSSGSSISFNGNQL